MIFLHVRSFFFFFTALGVGGTTKFEDGELSIRDVGGVGVGQRRRGCFEQVPCPILRRGYHSRELETTKLSHLLNGVAVSRHGAECSNPKSAAAAGHLRNLDIGSGLFGSLAVAGGAIALC